MRLVFLWWLMAAVTWAAERVDLNNAPRDAIESLPGVGPKLAEEIIRGRPYRTIEELNRVKGIGVKKLEAIRPKAVILPMRGAALMPPRATNQVARVNINTATKDDLEKLPGIGPVKADAIIAKRPFQRAEDLMKVEGIKKAQFEKLKSRVSVR